jgi:hypothetical protein
MDILTASLSESHDRLFVVPSLHVLHEYLRENPNDYYVFDHDSLIPSISSLLLPGHFTFVASRAPAEDAAPSFGYMSPHIPPILLPADTKAEQATAIVLSAIDRKEGVPHTIKCQAQ